MLSTEPNQSSMHNFIALNCVQGLLAWEWLWPLVCLM